MIEFNDNGNSIATTTIEIDDKVYQIKGGTYNHLPDGTYQCKVHYLPVTKIIESLYIENNRNQPGIWLIPIKSYIEIVCSIR